MRRPIRRTSRLPSESGQSLVELALTIPLLLLLLIGVVDVGRIIFTYIALGDAAQEGAIYSAHEATSTSAIINRVRSSSNHAEVTGSSVSVVCSVSPAPGTVAVTAGYDLQLLTPIAGQILGGTVHLSATFTGTNFKEQCP